MSVGNIAGKIPKAVPAAAFCALAGTAGAALRWNSGGTAEALLIVLLGLGAGGAVLYAPVQKARNAKEKRRRELTAQYPDMVTRLSLYMAAGLTLRSSWERMVRDYQAERTAGGKKRLVYEEMQQTRQDILGGVHEDRAYGEFGRRCALPEYLRLGGLLETYVQQGNKELLPMLESETASSLNLSLQNVKKRGERTMTLLLMPILLLFAITLLLVIAPALVQMQGSM